MYPQYWFSCPVLGVHIKDHLAAFYMEFCGSPVKQAAYQFVHRGEECYDKE